MADAVTADLLLGGRYRLLHELARGGMAAVWEAEDSVLGRRVAVKVLHPHLASDEAFRERFRREAVAVARLSHPSVVAVYDTGQDGDLSYLVMELVDGRTLRDVLAERGMLPVAEAVEIAAHVADGLAVAHERGIVHRDVKPGNVLVLADGRAKIADFGIARGGVDADGDLTQAGTIVGTARYLAPEQVRGAATDARTDVYALGLVLYEMLTGRPAFDVDDPNDVALAMARVQSDPLPPSQLRADVPRDLEAVVLRALAREPDDRFRDAGELRGALRGVAVRPLDSTPAAGLPVAPADRRFTLSVAAVVAIAMVVMLVGVFFAGTEAGRSVLQRVREGLPGSDAAEPVAIAGVRDWDPFGDGAENPDTAPLAHDGDATTAWKTDSYHAPHQQEFGRLKDGVGLRIDLGEEQALDRLVVQALHEGWNAAIYVGDGQAGDLAGWGEPVDTGSALGQRATFDLGGTRGSSVLLWITLLPEAGQLEIAEVDVQA